MRTLRCGACSSIAILPSLELSNYSLTPSCFMQRRSNNHGTPPSIRCEPCPSSWLHIPKSSWWSWTAWRFTFDTPSRYLVQHYAVSNRKVYGGTTKHVTIKCTGNSLVEYAPPPWIRGFADRVCRLFFHPMHRATSIAVVSCA